jgi:hypothetical protein
VRVATSVTVRNVAATPASLVVPNYISMQIKIAAKGRHLATGRADSARFPRPPVDPHAFRSGRLAPSRTTTRAEVEIVRVVTVPPGSRSLNISIIVVAPTWTTDASVAERKIVLDIGRPNARPASVVLIPR